MNKKKRTKLTLSSETIVNLSVPDLPQVAGQATEKWCSDWCTATYVCSGCVPCA